MDNKVVNVTFAGLGGQGVLKVSDILADAVFAAGLDVKKSEVHGMSQRGGSVCSEVRYGKQVFSPMVPTGSSDFLVVLEETQIPVNEHKLTENGVMLTVADIDLDKLENKKSMNVALLGFLSSYLNIPEECWIKAMKNNLPKKIQEVNFAAFKYGASLKK